jgi:hypothetical protein
VTLSIWVTATFHLFDALGLFAGGGGDFGGEFIDLAGLATISSRAGGDLGADLGPRALLDGVLDLGGGFLGGWALRWARLRTSSATTANPMPASPARAASTAALRARMLVWKAISSMVLMILATSSLEA